MDFDVALLLVVGAIFSGSEISIGDLVVRGGTSFGYLLKSNFVEAYYMPSGSMEETLLVGDYLLADKFIYGVRDPQPGDVVIFGSKTEPDRDLIKRCIAVPGQTVEIREKALSSSTTCPSRTLL